MQEMEQANPSIDEGAPETDPVQKLMDLRQRLFEGEEISAEEYELVLTALRAGRRAGAPKETAKKKKESNAPSGKVDTGALLSQLTTVKSST